MIEDRKCKLCGKEYKAVAEYKQVLKCESCDDSEYIIEKTVMEYCSMECLHKDNFIRKIIGGRLWKEKTMK